MHVNQTVVAKCESQCMPVTIGDFFEDEVTARSVELEGSVKIDSVMNIMDAMPGSDAEGKGIEQEPFLTLLFFFAIWTKVER